MRRARCAASAGGHHHEFEPAIRICRHSHRRACGQCRGGRRRVRRAACRRRLHPVECAHDARLSHFYGLDYAETRFSRLRQITAANVKDLGLVWTYNLESTRGVEATPLVVDGIMYVTASWSIVHAIDARTGRRLWSFDPQVPRESGYKGCCDVVNRGVALYRGKVFVGSFDGRLIALDAATGKRVWERDTIVDHRRSYTITGAPRVFKGRS